MTVIALSSGRPLVILDTRRRGKAISETIISQNRWKGASIRAVVDYARFGLDLVWGLTQLPRVIATSPKSVVQASQPRMAIGVNVAGAHDPAYDDYVIELLKESSVHHVRMAWSPASGIETERLFQRLIDDNFAVMVVLLPTPETAGSLAFDQEAQTEWRSFVQGFAARHGNKVDTLEIGNAPNRPKWSGYTPRSYLKAWQIATEELAALDVPLAGPNISDFEPFFNLAYLRSMRRAGVSPDIQTDNLFVERSVQPEMYDPSAMGRVLKNVMRFNLAKKVYVLSDIAQRTGVGQTYCSYTCWTRVRLARWTNQPERKGADYLARYLLIAAATGRLGRLYWGPLIDARDGLVDCGSDEYPFVDNVAHYQRVRGALADFKPSQAYQAFKFFTSLLQDSDCKRVTTNKEGLYCFGLIEDGTEHHVFFSLDRGAFDITSLYSGGLADAGVRDIAGVELSSFNGIVSESPVVVSWPESANQSQIEGTQFERLKPLGGSGVVHGLSTTHRPIELEHPDWQGVVSVARNRDDASGALLNPDQINTLEPILKLRDKRNKLWTVQSPSHACTLVVKLNRATGARRLSYLFAKSKAVRHWNNANEMLRRGVATPTPLAFFERKSLQGLRENYYVSEFVADSFTARDIFTAIKNGETTYKNIETANWLKILAEFVGLMHRRKIVHRDLSAGNLLIHLDGDEPVVSVIDIGRARIDSGLSNLLDLQRICYKMDWAHRELFIDHYQTANPRGKTRLWRLACHAYDYKLNWKRAIKGSLKRKRT